MEFYNCTVPSPLGDIMLCADGQNLIGLSIAGQRRMAGGTQKALPVFELAKSWLDIYFSGEEPDFTPPLRFAAGSVFARRVWARLTDIPYGTTVTYGELARELAAETGARPCAQAVGGAVGHNPISVIVPCHRVMGAGGKPTGYNGGIDKKMALLRLEGAIE